MDKWIDDDRWIDRWIDRSMDRWTFADGQMDR